MSRQLDFEDTIGDGEFPVIVFVSVYYERPDHECGLSGGWVAEFDEAQVDKDRHEAACGEMPAITPEMIERWEARACKIAEEQAEDDDLEMLRHV